MCAGCRAENDSMRAIAWQWPMLDRKSLFQDIGHPQDSHAKVGPASGG
jgi:hypothetical protein